MNNTNNKCGLLRQLSFYVVMLICCVRCFSADATAARKPNVVLILTDDQGTVINPF